jgi:hypothetical protein
MTFRVGTRDGTVVIADEADLEVVTAYLVLCGYPPVTIEAETAPSDAPQGAPGRARTAGT